VFAKLDVTFGEEISVGGKTGMRVAW